MNDSHSQLIASKAFRTCTPCCPFDTNNLPHPQIDIQQQKRAIVNSDVCCLSRLQVDCRIQYPKKKKSKKKKRLNSIHSYLSVKRKKFDSSPSSSTSLSVSSLNTTSSNLSQQSNSSNGSKRKFTYQNKSFNAQQYNSQPNINEDIQNLKNSIDNLRQLILQQASPKSNSLFTKIRHFLSSLPFPFKSSENRIDHECNEILQHHHLTRQDLSEIYDIFNRNDSIFLNWLRSFIPEYYLPFFLNYQQRGGMTHLNHNELLLCIVQGCSNGIQTNPSVQYFSVPAHVPNIAAAWYKNTMRTDLRPSHIHHVCEQHFEEACFDYVGNGTKVLKPKSLPTLFDLEVFYKMIAYQDKLQESDKSIKKTNITFHTSNPDLDSRTLEPILKMNSESSHVKARLAPTNNSSTQESNDSKTHSTLALTKPLLNHQENSENKLTNRCHVQGCIHNYVARRHRVQLYKIPRDSTVARRWLDICGYESMQISPTTSTFKVCREHFTPSDFEGPATLRSDAVPSLFTSYSRSLIDKRNSNEMNSLSPSMKRFRSDMASIRAKQTTPINTKYSQMSYRNTNNRQHQYEQQQQQMIHSPSPSIRGENFDENNRYTINESKQLSDVDLNMNCMDEPLSEVQLKHCPVKALDRTDTTNGLTVKPRNPVGRPRLHPRYPPSTTTTTTNSSTRRPAFRSNYADDADELDEFDDWNLDEADQDDNIRDRDWVNRQQDDRLPWSKRTHSTVNNNHSSMYQRNSNNHVNSYRNLQQQRSTTRGQFYPTQFVKPEPTRKAMIPFLQPAFAPNATTQYPRDQPLPRLKPGTVRTREEGLEVELEHTYKRALSKYYGQKPGRNLPLSDYGDFRCQCPLCDNVLFDNNVQLITHLCQHFDQQQQQQQNDENTPAQQFQPNTNSPFEQINTKCSHCQSEFSNPYFLAMHIDDKHMLELNDYRCRICEQTHNSLLELIAHLNLCHCGLEMPYFCEVCSFRTSMHADMIYHIDEVHKSTRYFFCPYCFHSIELPFMANSSTILNGTLAYKHLLLHFNKVDQGRTISSKFKHCRKCTLHVSSMKDHLQRDHLNIVDGIKATYYDEDENLEKQSDDGEQYDSSLLDTSNSTKLV